MTTNDPTTTTHQQLLDAPPAGRASIVEAYLIAAVRALWAEPAAAAPIGPDTRLSDLAIDSVQIVELKFGLDQLVGAELDVDLIVANPTVRELAERSVAAAGLA
jgi:acyl carrier protein